MSALKEIIIVIITGLILTCFSSHAQIFPDNLLWSSCSVVHNGYYSGNLDTSCKNTMLKLVMYDEFDSTALNENNWQRAYPWGNSLHSSKTGTGWERQYYTDYNVSVTNGALHLRTIVSPSMYPEPLNPASSVFFKYTSGMVYSKQGFKNGKMEMRGKIPYIDGLFPAFWGYGECQQEIDVFEFNNKNETSLPEMDASNMIMTHHKSYDCKNKQEEQCEHSVTKSAVEDLSKDFHIYSLEWNNYKIIWKLDGEILREVYHLWEVTPPPPAGPLYAEAKPIKSCADLKPNTFYTTTEPFVTNDNVLHIILNTAVSLDRAETGGHLPADFVIDYVKIYEEIETIAIMRDDFIFEVYPNPGDGIFFIDEDRLPNRIDISSIKDAFGKSTNYSLSKENGKIKIDMRQNPKGLYILQFEYGGGVFTKKIAIL